MSSQTRRGIVLFNLGGPEKLADVRPFLFNLFSDPDIIRIKNDSARRLLAWFIATTRQRKSRGLYRQIGGGSPLRKITEGQAEALARRLSARGYPAKVYVGMRCWQPTIVDAVRQIERDGISHLVALPLFPQFSVTTTGSCFKYFKKTMDSIGLGNKITVAYVERWFDEPLYLESMADLIRKAMDRFSDQDPRNTHLLYSAHSIPARYVAEGDPYLEQTEKTLTLIDEQLGNLSPSSLAFQSKVGPVKWLGPSTNSVLTEFGRRGTSRVLVVPISFVSDHIETLQEIDILYRELATKAGIAEFERAESLNLYPKFIEALANVSLRALQQMPDHG
jgi:ferrochelatase